MDFISNFNGLELIFIIILAILLFGPEKIPEIAAKLGSWVRTIQNLSSQVMENLREETGFSEFSDEGASISAALNQTVADINSTSQTLSQQITADPSQSEALKGTEKQINQGQRQYIPQGDNKEQLEERLRALETELIEIQKMIAKEGSVKTSENND
jgi:Sec-independent protein translocase protein TatA